MKRMHRAARFLTIIAISTDTVELLQNALRTTECDLPIFSDPELKTFQATGCLAAGKPLLRTFVMDTTRKIRCSTCLIIRSCLRTQ